MTDLLYCPYFSRVAYAITGTKTAVCCRLRCKRWSCEYCSKKNAAIWRAHLKDRLPKVSDEWWILTLTAPPWARSAAASLDSIRTAVEALIKRCKRVFGKDMQYVRVYEKHPTSEAIHSHFIISGLTPYVVTGCSEKLQPMAIGVLTRVGRNGVWSVKTWFKKVCQELHMGRQVDVQLIVGPVETAAFYVAKYLSKALQDIKIKGLRHIQTTRKIGKPEEKDSHGWQTAPYLTAYAFEAGTRVTDLQTGEIIDNNYWELKRVWPDSDI